MIIKVVVGDKAGREKKITWYKGPLTESQMVYFTVGKQTSGTCAIKTGTQKQMFKTDPLWVNSLLYLLIVGV